MSTMEIVLVIEYIAQYLISRDKHHYFRKVWNMHNISVWFNLLNWVTFFIIDVLILIHDLKIVSRPTWNKNDKQLCLQML